MKDNPMLTCDDAFDCLTNATQRESVALTAHLQSCPRCRQMAEVLAPALTMLQTESVPAGPVARRPLLSPEAIQLAEQSAAELHRRTAAVVPPARPASAWPRLFPLAALSLLLLAGVFAWTLLPEESASPMPMLADQSCLWKQPASERPETTVKTVVLSCVACHLESR